MPLSDIKIALCCETPEQWAVHSPRGCSAADGNSTKPTCGAAGGGILSWQQYSLQLNLLSAYGLHKLHRITSGK